VTVTALDRRMMAAAIRLSMRHCGRTASNPSVATLIVRDDGEGPVIVGRGVTALGGRPHAEALALAEAGELARGATAYVTLEPCAHHGRTPPCAAALVTAGVARVVAAATDPDGRVSGKGYAILREGGIAVEPGVLAEEAARAMAGYLMQRTENRPHVTLKLAVSADGKIGRAGIGQVAVTGRVARAQVHLLRARSHAILVGIGTVLADDPELTCRLPELEDRSPIRIVLDRHLQTPLTSKLATSARHAPLWLATTVAEDDPRRAEFAEAGVELVAAVETDGKVALPELLEDLAARGIQSLMVEGGASVARSFLDEGLVDRIALYTGPDAIGKDGIEAPFSRSAMPADFRLVRAMTFDRDTYEEFERGL
jgi:diaminohydroxyphosphoribosylaminopyrimidine deaminase/5-amino-6-(5-phosphoribosylamino)uracil reductase